MASKTITELETTTASVYVPCVDNDGLTRKIAVTQMVANEFDALDVPTLVSQAQESAFEAADFAEKSNQHASAPRGTLLEDGTYSSLHYSELSRDYGRSAALIPEKEIDGTVSSPYTLVEEDKFRTLVFTRSTALTVICPQNWNTSPASDGSSSQAWVDAVRTGSGLITFTGQATTTTLTPTVIARDNFVATFSAEPPTAQVGNHSIVVPAGNNRKIVFQLYAIYGSNKTGRSATLTATNTSSLSKPFADTSRGSYGNTTDSPLPVVQWTANMADSATATTVAIVVTPDDDPYCYVLIVTAISNAAALLGPIGSSATANSTTVTVPVTTPMDKCLVIGGMNIQGGDVIPLTLSGPGTQRFNGRTGSRGVKDFGYVSFEHYAETAGTYNYVMTSDQSDQGAYLAIYATPNTSSLVASTLVAADGATLSAAGKCCTIRARSDGVTFIKDQ